MTANVGKASRNKKGMSYINQALRKAQEAKDSPYTPYRRFIEAGEGRGGRFSRGALWAISGGGALLLVAAVWIFAGGWPPFSGDKTAAQAPAAPREAAVDAAPLPPVLSQPEETGEIKSFFEQAIAAQRLRRFADAERLYGQILALMPAHKKSLNNLGILYLENGDFIQGRQFLERAVAADAAWADPHYNLACLLGRQGKAREGLAHLEKAIMILPAALDWAATDKDLRGIRRLPEYEKLKEAAAK